MFLGELDRGPPNSGRPDKLPKDKLKSQSFDLSGWTVARFLLGSELALRKGAAAEAAALADETLASLSEKEEKSISRPGAARCDRVYVTAARSADAKRCLDEYLALVQDQQAKAPSVREIAGSEHWSKQERTALRCDDLLEPTMGKDPNDPRACSYWRRPTTKPARRGER